MTRGFSLLEMIIALAIISTTLIAIILLTIGLQDVSIGTQIQHDALLRASSGILREMARGTDGFPVTQSSGRSEYDGLISSTNVSEIGDGSAKSIVSTVSWKTRLGLSQDIQISGFITDYKNASDYGCSPFLAGNWATPKSDIYAGILPALTTLSATRSFIVVAASSTAGFLDPSLFVFKNVTSSETIEPIVSFDSATSTKTGYVAIAVSSSHIYALSAHVCPQGNTCAALDIFSFTEDTLTRINTIPIPPGRSIFYKNKRLYIGLRTTPLDAEFLVFDTSAPGQPTRIGSSEIGDSVNDIVVIGSTAYIGTADNSASGNKALMAFNIESPREEMQAISRSRQIGAGISQHLARSGLLLFLGRSSPLNSKEFYVFRAPDIRKAVSERDTDSTVTGISAHGLDAFVLTRTRLDRLNIERPEDPLLLDSFSLPHGMSGIALACNGRRFIVAANNSSGGHLIILSGL